MKRGDWGSGHALWTIDSFNNISAKIRWRNKWNMGTLAVASDGELGHTLSSQVGWSFARERGNDVFCRNPTHGLSRLDSSGRRVRGQDDIIK